MIKQLIILIATLLQIFSVGANQTLLEEVAFWPFDQNELLSDVSGYGNHGINGGGAILVPNAQGTIAGAYQFTGNADSYVEFPNNGAYDTRYSIHVLMYIFPQGTNGPTFNFKRDDWRVHMSGGNEQFAARFMTRNTLSLTATVNTQTLELNNWNFVGASYNHNTGLAKLWVMDQLKSSKDIGIIELATNYEVRIGAVNIHSNFLRAMVSCMQVYDRELSPSEILAAESRCKIDTENPVINCTSDLSTSTFIDIPMTSVTWPIPLAADNSGTVQIRGSHEPGSNFSIGNTVVSYEASDPNDNKATCSFTITVEAKIRPLFDRVNGTSEALTTNEVIKRLDELSTSITGLYNMNVSQEQSKDIAYVVLNAIDVVAVAILSSFPDVESGRNDTDAFIQSLLNTADKLATFVLLNKEPGTDPLLLETSSLLLNLDSGSPSKFVNSSIEVGIGYGFILPGDDKLFFSLTEKEGSLNRIVKRLKRRSLQKENDGNGSSENDVLALSFTDREGNEVEVNNTTDEIQIMFASDFPANEEHVLVEGIYLDMDDVTYFGTVFKVSKLDHAVVIMLENSEPLYGNATSYIFNDVVKYSNQYRGYQFSVNVQFSGNHSKIFIPDDYFMTTGFYFLTFTILGKREMKFSVAVKEIMCTYMEKRSSTWGRDGCQVGVSSYFELLLSLENDLFSLTVD
ncbi:uncharacterized protein [Ptychodera flava]|uniref:uncharacterized protein n=1 Tax=Ptychodera flava TaxID=63121 RepID=UPI003969D352